MLTLSHPPPFSPSLSLASLRSPTRFEIFETLRKLALTGGLIVFDPGTPAQICISMLICLFSMRVYAEYQPFIEESVDILAETAQWQLFFTMFGALAIRTNIRSEDPDAMKAFDGVLALIQFMSFFVVIVQHGRVAPMMYKKYKGQLDEELKKRNLFGYKADPNPEAEVPVKSADIELTVAKMGSKTPTEIVVVKEAVQESRL
jgi:hypothetical protein